MDGKTWVDLLALMFTLMIAIMVVSAIVTAMKALDTFGTHSSSGRFHDFLSKLWRTGGGKERWKGRYYGEEDYENDGDYLPEPEEDPWSEEYEPWPDNWDMYEEDEDIWEENEDSIGQSGEVVM